MGINKILPQRLQKSTGQLRRGTIKTKSVAEKVGHAVGDRAPVAAAIAGPAVPILGVSQGLAGVYVISPRLVKKIPGLGKVITKAEDCKVAKAIGKPIHEFTDYLFKAGKHTKPVRIRPSVVPAPSGIPATIPAPAPVPV